MKTVNLEQIQRRFQHGLSDEQWEECKDSFPYPDMRAAMREACNQCFDLAAEESKINSIDIGDETKIKYFEKQSILDLKAHII